MIAVSEHEIRELKKKIEKERNATNQVRARRYAAVAERHRAAERAVERAVERAEARHAEEIKRLLTIRNERTFYQPLPSDVTARPRVAGSPAPFPFYSLGDGAS